MKKLILLLLLASPLYAQDKKISELTSGSPVQAADMIPIARSGANFRLAGSDFLYTGGPGVGCATPPYNFAADTNAGMCLYTGNEIRLQTAPFGTASSSSTILTSNAAAISHWNASSLLDAFQVIDGSADVYISNYVYGQFTSTGLAVGHYTINDQIKINPAVAGASPKYGVITSADLTDNRTWTFSDASGTVVLGTATDDTVLVGNGSTWAVGTLPNGLVSYNTSTNAFSLGTAVTDPGSNGILSRTALNTVVAREIVSADGSIIVSNGTGVSGNPDLSVDNAVYERFSAGTATPTANCVAGSQVYAETDRNHLWFCSSTNTWTDIGPVDVSALVDFTSGTATPSAACTAGKSVYAETDRNALWACTSTNTWTDLTTDTTGYATIQDEGSGLTQRTTLNFAGDGVSCADATTKTTCTIAGGSSSFDPSTTFEVYEEFLAYNTTGGQIGTHGWYGSAFGNGTTYWEATLVAGHIGTQTLVSGTDDNSGYIIALPRQDSVAIPISSVTSKDWDFDAIARLDSSALTSSAFWIGLGTISDESQYSGARIRYDTDDSDSTFMFQLCNNLGNNCTAAGDESGSTVIASTITPSTNTWYRFRIRHRMSGVGSLETYYFRVNNETEKTFCSSGCDDVISNAPTYDVALAVAGVSRASSTSREVAVDYVYFKMTGLSRY